MLKPIELHTLGGTRIGVLDEAFLAFPFIGHDASSVSEQDTQSTEELGLERSTCIR